MQNYAKALIEFQYKCPAIDKDAEVEVRTKTGGNYRFKYASFGNIVQTIKEPMYLAKLAYTFVTSSESFTCRVVHESGEYSETSIPMPKFRESMQENGSFLTYLKRYSLVLALGLDTDADDDGNLGDGNTATFNKEPKSKPVGYVVKVGKFKDRSLNTIDKLQLQDYLTWLHNSATEKGKPLTGDWLEFAKHAETYLTEGL
jgi:hypothetical protein